MKLSSLSAALLWVVGAGLGTASPARAGHHSWDFTEVFSNGDGSVQFVEMFCPNNGESGLGPFGITGGNHPFTFVTNLSGTTANTWVLIATTAFAALPGAPTPDYVLPDGFLDTGGGALVYAGGADTWNYGAVPTDGLLSLFRNGSTGANTPKNFAGVEGNVDASGGGGPTPTPALTTWGLILLVGLVLFAASGLLRRTPAAA